MKKHLPSQFCFSPEWSTKGSRRGFSGIFYGTRISNLGKSLWEHMNTHFIYCKLLFLWFFWKRIETFSLSESVSKLPTLKEIIRKELIYSRRIMANLGREELYFQIFEKFFCLHRKIKNTRNNSCASVRFIERCHRGWYLILFFWQSVSTSDRSSLLGKSISSVSSRVLAARSLLLSSGYRISERSQLFYRKSHNKFIHKFYYSIFELIIFFLRKCIFCSLK